MKQKQVGRHCPAAEIRDLFFIHSRDWRYGFLPSNPVVPIGDPKRPFHGALDNLKQAFLSPATQVSYSMHCINMGDNVDDFADACHQSLIDIIGTWSGGPNSKENEIRHAWNFLTGLCKLPADRIHVTCFGGDTRLGLQADTHTRDIWRAFNSNVKILNSSSKADYYCGKDGYGPCGPCTRILFRPYVNCHHHLSLNVNGEELLELATIVSVEFNRSKDDIMMPLVNKHAATGLNFECLVSAIQRKESCYDTDIFTPVLKAIHNNVGDGVQSYNGGPTAVQSDNDDATAARDVEKAYRIVADHMRIIACASSPQAQLGERGREYLLSCMDKRAIQFGHKKLKIEAERYPESFWTVS